MRFKIFTILQYCLKFVWSCCYLFHLFIILDGAFTFQATLLKNGDVIFAYKDVSIRKMAVNNACHLTLYKQLFNRLEILYEEYSFLKLLKHKMILCSKTFNIF